MVVSTDTSKPDENVILDSKNQSDVATDASNEETKGVSNTVDMKGKTTAVSCQSSAESSYIRSGDSTKTIVSMNNSGKLRDAQHLINCFFVYKRVGGIT